MIQPKLRLFDDYYKKMYFSDDYDYVATGLEKERIGFGDFWDDEHYVVSGTPSSFTGAMDKNDLHIYSGDIVRIRAKTVQAPEDKPIEGIQEKLCLVEWWADKCCFTVDKVHPLSKSVARHYYEVVGNKWENPGLFRKISKDLTNSTQAINIGQCENMLDHISNEERRDLFRKYCLGCGVKNPNCPCERDE